VIKVRNQPAAALDVDRLKEQFQEVERRHAELRQQMAEQNAANRQSLADQFAVLSATLLPAGPNPTFIRLVRTVWSFDEREDLAQVGR
jgi:hypothetical protein